MDKPGTGALPFRKLGDFAVPELSFKMIDLASLIKLNREHGQYGVHVLAAEQGLEPQ